MKFWDTSAVIPLLVEEPSSEKLGKLFSSDNALLVWWGTSIECVSAISRLEREDAVNTADANRIFDRLQELRLTWREIQPGTRLKQIAERILRLHPLRSQDAQQLAACSIANTDQLIEFVTLDGRLQTAARKEGLTLFDIE